jgi:hypothetical protein
VRTLSQTNKSRRCTSVVEHLYNMCKALGFIPKSEKEEKREREERVTKKRKREREREEGRKQASLSPHSWH